MIGRSARTTLFATLARLALGIAIATACPARAEERGENAKDDAAGDAAYLAVARSRGETYPRLGGEIAFEIQNDARYRSQNPDRQLNTLFSRIGAELSAQFTESFSVESEITLEPLDEELEDRPDNRELKSQALFIEQLFGKFQGEGFEVHVGKFNPRFGKAFEFAAGPYGEGKDFSDGYSIEERIGAGASYEVELAALGTQSLGAEAFFLDTSNLSRSALRSRGKLRRSDGGPSNTGSPNSFSLGLEGSDIPAIPRLGYNLGFVYQKGGRSGLPAAASSALARDRDEEDDDEHVDRGNLERDYVAGLTYSLAPLDAVNVDLLTEFAYIDNADGEANRLRRFLTFAASTEWSLLRFGLSYEIRNEAVPMASDNHDTLFLASVGRFVAVGRNAKIGFETGYRAEREEQQRTNTVALRLSYALEF